MLIAFTETVKLLLLLLLMQLHFVSYNTKYSTIGESLGHSDGLAVLGALIQVGGSDNSAFSFLDICSNLTTSGKLFVEIQRSKKN